MKKNIYIHSLLTLLLMYTMQARSQTAEPGQQADSLFKAVKDGNPELIAARRQLEAARLEAGTGITPENPEVEFGYMGGNPSSIGNRVDFSVSQHFDFPTTYFRMADAQQIRQDQAMLIYDVKRQRVLTEARKLMIVQIHQNRLAALLEERLKQAGRLKEQYMKMLETGEVGKLSLSQVNLQLSVLRADLEQVQSERRQTRERFLEITGGRVSGIDADAYPAYEIPGADELREAYAAGPEATLYAREIALKKKQKQVAVSKALPDLTAGYYSETVIDEGFRGVSLGISVPLWADKNRVKFAKADISVAEAQQARFRSAQQSELARNLERRLSLATRIRDLEQVLSEVDDVQLLGIALELGEISLSEYIYSTEFYLQNVRRLMEYERDLKLVEAELLKIYL